MAENISTTDHYYTKEFGGYRNTEDNFVANQELTVTITLNEYRELIKNNATQEDKASEARSAKYKAESDLRDAEKEITELKERIYNLMDKTEAVAPAKEAVE